MNAKFFIYIFVTIITVWAFDSVNINALFKKDKVLKSQVFYFLILLAIIYLITSLIYDFIYLKFW